MILRESIQLVHLGPNDALQPSTIFDVLRRAQVNRCYAKFYTDKYWIQVNFQYDNKMSVSSNIRNPLFVNEIWRIDKYEGGWNFTKVQSFVYKWMQLQRRILY